MSQYKIGDLILNNDSFILPLVKMGFKKLTIALGYKKDTLEPVTINLKESPHILIAGATGSGKSVALNTAICSLLLNNSNADISWLMIDTKRVELSQYNGLFGLLKPIAETYKDAEYLLRYAIVIMDDRYKLMKKYQGKHIDDLKDGKQHPHLAIVIDELADLIYGDKQNIEPLLIKLATLGRASGIHLIVATQRPTVDVVCGQFKANIDTRLALRVASIRDSLNIIDRKGAEELKGAGDGLLKLPTQAKEIPLQVAYISDYNIRRVVAYKKGELKL